jgi:hypothetical protein
MGSAHESKPNAAATNLLRTAERSHECGSLASRGL